MQAGRTDTDQHGLAQTDTDEREHGRHVESITQGKTVGHKNADDASPTSSSGSVHVGPCLSISSAALAANAALSLLNLTCHLLDRQIAARAEAFEKEGGFTERPYRVRSQRRNNLY